MTINPSPRSYLWLKLIGLACVVAVLIVAIKVLDLQALFQTMLAWVEGLGAWGPIAFIAIYSMATIMFVPGSLLTLGGGILFGVVWGSVYVFIAATTGATLAFLISRYLVRDWVAKQIAGNVKFAAIDQAIAREGFKVVVLTRLSPLFPFSLLNYAFGITNVSLSDYVLGSISMIPGTFLYVYIGSLLGDLATLGTAINLSPAAERLRIVLNSVGVIATIAVTLYVTSIARSALQQAIAVDTSLSTDEPKLNGGDEP
ncbi:MAG: TVP38/TMEM64 family protein [Cyanobacteria bacterium]|nr:TVP38/TMEM64 family protein [Cyanobacteriota bacterium]MDW8201067.1 TVP38/TMEM64 family protein [Cyanobacteriota bacterium SKYGB_h_bin112]